MTVEPFYGDEEGGQRTITRYTLLPHRGQEGAFVWLAVIGRHWNIDRANPR